MNNELILIICCFVGEANVLQEFEIKDKKKKLRVAGCRCTKGMLKKDAMYRLMRNQDVMHTGKKP